jgi:hypothetical protein
LISGAGSVSSEHLSASPTGKTHEILFLSTVCQPPMSECVTEHVRVEVIKTSLLGPASKHLADAVVGHIASTANPELATFGKTMLAALSEVTLDGLASFVTEWTSTRSTALAENEGNVSIKINVGERETGHLREAHTGIQKKANDGRVTPVVKTSAAHTAKQAGKLGLIQDGHRLFRNGGWAEAGHRCCIISSSSTAHR